LAVRKELDSGWGILLKQARWWSIFKKTCEYETTKRHIWCAFLLVKWMLWAL